MALFVFCRVSGLVDVGGLDGIGDICLHVGGGFAANAEG